MIWSVLLACLFAVLALATPARAAEPPPRAQHVVVVGLSGLRWSDVSATRTPSCGGWPARARWATSSTTRCSR